MSRRLPLLVLLVAATALAGCGSDPARTPPARLASTTVPSVVIAAVGDIACPPGRSVTSTQCQQGATARLVRGWSPARVLELGDEQYDVGAYTAFMNSFDKSWGVLRGISWPVVGNHEYYTAGASGYYRYFSTRAAPAPGYYRRSINGWQLYLLNTNCTQVDCVAERNWLANSMNGHPSRCSLIAMHHPRYSSGGEHGSQSVSAQFWRVALKHRADLALAGHDHDYERFAPMDNAGNPVSTGIQSFVSGVGGRSLYPKGATVRGSRFFDNRHFGALRLTLRPYGYSWQYRTTGGALLDSGTRACA